LTIKAKQDSAQPEMLSVEEEVRTPISATLLTPQQLAERLAVPPSWVREKTRERARVRDKDPLPVVRLGKYVRFDWEAVRAWLNRQGS
jgi:hypothetical protein